MEFKRIEERFLSRGLALNAPLDQIPTGYFAGMKNLRSYVEGELTPRKGLTPINSSPTVDSNIHSITRTNNYTDTDWTRYLGIDSSLYYGKTSFSSIEAGFSGDPLSFIPYQPPQSNKPWTYIGNAAKMRKVLAGDTREMGIIPPRVMPTAELIPPQYTPFNPFNSTSGWTNHGDCGAVTTGNRLAGVTVGSVLADTTFPGWCCISPASGNFSEIVAGMLITIGGGPMVVEETFLVTCTTGNTISTIIYDNAGIGATTGACTIQPAYALNGLRRNALLTIGGEEVRVISVTNAPNGVASFRCVTANNHSGGASIVPPANGSFRVYSGGPISAGNNINTTAVYTIITTGGVSTPGAGSIAYNTAAVDISNIGGRTLGPDDYIHLSFKCDYPERIVEGKLILGVDDAISSSVYAATDGTQNAYYKPFRPSDYQANLVGDETGDTARNTALNLQQQNESNVAQPNYNPGFDTEPFGIGGSSSPADVVPPAESAPAIPASVSTTSQMILGESQWTEFRWRLADLIRVGSKSSCSLATVRSVQLSFVVSGECIVYGANLWTGGGYGPDSGTNLTPFIYRYRYRDSTTGAFSRPGPAMRSGIRALRQGVTLTATAPVETYYDKIDFERLGGQNLTWNYIGTCDRSSPTLLDYQSSAAVVVNPALPEDAYVPFPVAAAPQSFSVTMAGTAVYLATPDFNPNLAIGTLVKINGVATSVYASPVEYQVLHLADSVGNGAGTLEIPEPIIQGTPMPVMWGPYQECLFGAGSDLNSGTVYWTLPGNPDVAPEVSHLIVGGASETMMNGCLYDNRAYCWSDRRLFATLPAFDGVNKFTFTEIPGAKGLIARWAFTVGPKVWYVASDGIYEFDGGSAINICEAIRPLFPQGERPGVAVNGIQPPKLTLAGSGSQALNIRLSYHNGYLYFDYLDINDNNRSLVYDVASKAWYLDVYYEAGGGAGVNCRFSEFGLVDGDEVANLLVGTNFGQLVTPGGTADVNSANTYPIACQLETGANNAGDARMRKLWGDAIVGLNPDGASVTVLLLSNNLSTLVSTAVYNTSVYAIQRPIDIQNGAGIVAHNLGCAFSWSSSTATPVLRLWAPSFLSRPDDTLLRGEDWTDCGFRGSKYVRGILIEADTFGLNRSLAVQGDQGTLATLTINHNGQLLQCYPFNPPIQAEMLRVLGTSTDNNPWQDFKVSYIYDEYPELKQLYSPWTNGGFNGRKYIRGAIINADTANLVQSLQVQGDGGTILATLSLLHNGQERKPYYFQPPIETHNIRTYAVGPIRFFEDTVWIYDKYPELSSIPNEITDCGFTGRKYFRGAVIEADTNGTSVTVKIMADGVLQQNLTINHSGKQEKPYAVTPFTAHEIQTIPISPGTYGEFKIRWIFDEYPELASITTEWTAAGFDGDKYLRGMVLNADTGGVPTNVTIQGDSGALITLSVSHNGQQEKPYAFPTPFISHLVRFVPIGNFGPFQVRWIYDQYPENSPIVTPFIYDGTGGAKYVRGVLIEASGSGSVNVEYDGGILQGALSLAHPFAALSTAPYSFNPPFIAHELRLNPNGTTIRIGTIKWIYDEYPELAAIVTPYDDNGDIGAKFMQGMVLEGVGSDPNLKVEYDGGQLGATVNAVLPTVDGSMGIVPYSFNPVFIGHRIRLNPSVPIRLGRIKWVYEPHPELAENWITQGSDLGVGAWSYLKEIYFAYSSSSTVTLEVIVDGTTFTYTFPSTGGVYTKAYILVQQSPGGLGDPPLGKLLKGKLYTFKATSAAPGFRLYKESTEVRVVAWTGGQVIITKPFGGPSNRSGAEI